MHNRFFSFLFLFALMFFGCQGEQPSSAENTTTEETTSGTQPTEPVEVMVQAEIFATSSGLFSSQGTEEQMVVRSGSPEGYINYTTTIPVSGTYKCTFQVTSRNPGTLRLEDQFGSYPWKNISGKLNVTPSDSSKDFQTITFDGFRLEKGDHNLRLFFTGEGIKVDYFKFTLLEAK